MRDEIEIPDIPEFDGTITIPSDSPALEICNELDYWKGEYERMQCGICAIVSDLVNGNSEKALKVAEVVMNGGSVTNPLDFHKEGVE